MLNFLDFLGTVGGNVLGLPGLVGLALGMMTRNWVLAVIMGIGIGAIQSLLFSDFQLAESNIYDVGIAVLIGVLASLVGCAIRHKGATV
ncbi:hypothetical protein ACP2AV_01410 [Aliiroseovarius sp. PTFE2010]|uniref:hypothetical protein n=1 Tax=Aliiroseovarius sp. PTFE2010 TaxID=3417190 RepID=UPI003CEF99E9